MAAGALAGVVQITPEVVAMLSAECMSPVCASVAVAQAPSRWTVAAIEALFELPFADLLYRAQQIHRAHHAPNTVQLSTLLSIKTGGCPEDCGYCPQAKRYHTGIDDEALLDLDTV